MPLLTGTAATVLYLALLPLLFSRARANTLSAILSTVYHFSCSKININSNNPSMTFLCPYVALKFPFPPRPKSMFSSHIEQIAVLQVSRHPCLPPCAAHLHISLGWFLEGLLESWWAPLPSALPPSYHSTYLTTQWLHFLGLLL